MKLTKIALGLTAAAAIFMAGCAEKTYTEESLGLRKTDLYSENTTVGDETKYATAAAGTSQYIDRAFENAPPMIPHSVDGMLPITIKNNACLGCHEPAVAASLNATSVPKSHLTDYRPNTSLGQSGKIAKVGQEVDNTSDLLASSTVLNKVSGSRFNCSQCHAPQSDTALIVENEFQADFRKAGHNRSSNLADNINEGL